MRLSLLKRGYRWATDFFKAGEEPLPVFEHPLLGHSEWSDDEEAWIGSFNGISYCLAYRATAEPLQELCDFAVSMLSDREGLLSSLEAAKEEARREYPNCYTSEITSLTLGLVHFSKRRGKPFYVLAELKGGLEFRAWRIEYQNDQCLGVGFDS